MTRRTISFSLAAIALAVAVVVAVTSAGGGGQPAGASGPKPSTSTATVTRRDLVDREELDGTLGYGDPFEVAVGRPGTVTSTPDPGSIVDRNGVVAEVDGVPVRLLFGARPLWRDLHPDVTDGADVRQLEENLVAMGHASLTPNDDWTDATTVAVKRWQKANGATETGTVSMGDVVFSDGAVRVVEAAERSLTVTSTTKTVTVDLEADRRDLLPVGANVDIELPDGKTTAGVVSAVDSVVTQPSEQQGGEPTVGVTISLADPSAVPFDEAPVDVTITATKAAGVLTVPVDALLATAGGGYAVELLSGSTKSLVPVELGAFADGNVEVRGDLEEGDEVVVP